MSGPVTRLEPSPPLRSPKRVRAKSCEVPRPAIGKAEHDGQENDDHHEIEHGERGAIADIRSVTVDAVDIARHGVGGTTWAAARDVDHDIGKLELKDDADQQCGD